MSSAISASEIANSLCNLDAERSVLGALLQDAGTHALLNEIAPDDFYSPAHREIYAAIVATRDKGRTPDLVTADESLTARNTLEGVGGTQYLIQLTQHVPTTANTRAYADILLEYSNRRKVYALAQDMQRRVVTGMDNLAEIVLDSSNALRGISVVGGKFVHISDALMRMYDDAVNARENPEKRIKTGIRAIDMYFKGFRNSRLTILGAPTSVGKSAFAMAIAMAAARDGWNVGYISLEMASTEFAQRMVSSRTSLTATDIDDGRLTDDQMVELTSALGPLSTYGIRFVEDAFTIEEIFARAQWMTEQGHIDFLVIDHLHLIGTAKNFQGDTQKTKYVSQRLKHLAMTINRPVLAVAQLSRAPVARRDGDRRPVISDLRDSSSLEQDANNVLMLHQYKDANEPGMDDTERGMFERLEGDGKHLVCVRCLKQRQGRTFDVNVVFYPAHMRFEAIERRRTWVEQAALDDSEGRAETWSP